MPANTAVWERLFHTFFTPGELRDPMPHVHGDDTNDSLGHPADRIHLGVHPDDDDDNDNTHNTPPTQTLAVQFAAINRPRPHCPANAGCQWFHLPNMMVTAAAVATADHDTDRNSMPVARRRQRSSNDNTTATAIAVFFVLHGDRGYNPRYRAMVVWYTTVFLHRGVESYTAGLTRSYGCGAAAGAVSRVAGMVLGNDTRGATRVIPYTVQGTHQENLKDWTGRTGFMQIYFMIGLQMQPRGGSGGRGGLSRVAVAAVSKRRRGVESGERRRCRRHGARGVLCCVETASMRGRVNEVGGDDSRGGGGGRVETAPVQQGRGRRRWWKRHSEVAVATVSRWRRRGGVLVVAESVEPGCRGHVEVAGPRRSRGSRCGCEAAAKLREQSK
ncbi:hypothetical protein EDB85DRAFT_1899441 [Lactarius pseudohatsudake]|nr:hypothetical protein EDB85DRAFT_1899441 [Lactarius pseudohatsudake]